MHSPSALYPGFSTPAVERIWSAESRVGAMLRFEEALALALADAGVAPEDEAEGAAAACRSGVADPEAILASTWETGTPLVALLDEVRTRLSDADHRRWLHHGATTQDAVDTAHMLLAHDSLDVIEESLTRICQTLATLARAHRGQPHIARTFLQTARPTTFGRRVAGWLEPVLSHREGVRSASRDLAVQLGGPVGDRFDYGAAAGGVVAALADRLGLVAAPLAWHADRSPVWSLVEAVAAPVRSVAKTALDLALLAGGVPPEVTMRAGGSSSIPGKRNPVDAMRALAAADAFRGAAVMITGAGPQELDRGLGSWHVEWFALPLVFGTASAVFEAAASALESLEVDTEAMASRVPPGEATDSGGADIDAVLARFEQLVGRR